jgi:dTDP-4-dehydrorhamnose reductase
MALPTICVTGSGGLIGSHIVRLLHKTYAGQCRVIGLTRQMLNLTDELAVRGWFETTTPSVVIHCAAITNNPDCEKDPSQSILLNVSSCQWIFESVPDAWVCHFSTDLVFDGQKGNYVESDPIHPIGIYAETKAESERIAQQHPRACIVRTSLNAGTSPTGNRGFNEKLRHAWAAAQELKCFTDEYRCPIPAEVTARVVVELLKKQATGIFHVAGSDRMSRYEIAQLIAANWQAINPKIIPGSLAEYSGPPRSPDCSLVCRKVERILPFSLPGFKSWFDSHPDAMM